MHEIELELIKLLTNQPKRYGGERGPVEARNAAEMQPRLYERLFETLSIPFGETGVSGNMDTSWVALRELLLPRFSQFPVTVKDEMVRSPMPVLDDFGVEQFRKALTKTNPPPFKTPEQIHTFVDFLAGAIVFELLQDPRKLDPNKISNTVREQTRVGMIRYGALRAIYLRLQSDGDHLSFGMSKLKDELQVASSAIEHLREVQRSQISTQDIAIESVNDAMTQTEEKASALEKRLEELTHSAEARIVASETAINERLKLRGVTSLWDDRARQAEKALQYSIGCLIGLALAGLLTAVFGGRAIIDFVSPLNFKTLVLNASAGGVIAQQLGRILVVSVPVAVYFWLLKIVVRFIIRSLLLMDDARQRHTIMQAYFRITTQDSSDERALPMMLWAIFRQVPGHGPDGIEPPDFTEAINAGLRQTLPSAK
ncbi:MAG TPA: DUF6161 domain-containing protein [Ensifer sp.]|jgi:uncharacterized coiled-coil protein SlyX|uniref:DUF6161 domain-containing protein n=1 Tax=Ensifer sp. TaxID=1872086 RepID=UPI002E134288|nr:DUF6161 domain-containing protein [Ensifer sp.]